jgi:tetratricopeptide (TPR) repeat protein
MNAERMQKLNKLLEKEPNDAFLNFGLAMELAKGERWEESLAQFEKTIALDPKYIAAYFHRGKTLVNKGDIEAARTALEIGIAKAGELGEQHSKSEMEELLNSL